MEILIKSHRNNYLIASPCDEDDFDTSNDDDDDDDEDDPNYCGNDEYCPRLECDDYDLYDI